MLTNLNKFSDQTLIWLSTKQFCDIFIAQKNMN